MDPTAEQRLVAAAGKLAAGEEPLAECRCSADLVQAASQTGAVEEQVAAPWVVGQTTEAEAEASTVQLVHRA